MESFVQSNDQNMLLVVIICCIIIFNQQRERSFLTRSGLLRPHKSPWMKLLIYGDDNSFLEVTGLTRICFDNLRIILFPEHEQQRNHGRPLLLDKWSQIGILLLYLNSSMAIKHLCLIFGITPSTVSLYISSMLTRTI